MWLAHSGFKLGSSSSCHSGQHPTLLRKRPVGTRDTHAHTHASCTPTASTHPANGFSPISHAPNFWAAALSSIPQLTAVESPTSHPCPFLADRGPGASSRAHDSQHHTRRRKHLHPSSTAYLQRLPTSRCRFTWRRRPWCRSACSSAGAAAPASWESTDQWASSRACEGAMN